MTNNQRSLIKSSILNLRLGIPAERVLENLLLDLVDVAEVTETQIATDLAIFEQQRVQEIARSNTDRQRNYLKQDIERDNFILPKKYRTTLLRALKTYEWTENYLGPEPQREISDLLSILDKRG